MELTPFLLLSLGDVPGMGLRRFKMESLWRPQPVRQTIPAIFLGSRPPAIDTPVRRALFGWMTEECDWLLPAEEPWGSEAALVEALRLARERALAAEVLDAVRRLPSYSVRVTEYREWFAPEVCLLADAGGVSAASLSRLIRILAHQYRRPIHLALVLPAPHEATWAQAHDLVQRTELQHGPELLARLWLLSRERESGELLSPLDLGDALSHFCHLLAYAGWTADPGLRAVVRGAEVLATTAYAEPTAILPSAPRLVAFGVRAFRFPAAILAQQLALQQAQDQVERMLTADGHGRPQAQAERLDDTLVQARHEARHLVPPISPPVLDTGVGLEDDLAHWRMQVRLRWLPRAAERVEEVVHGHLAPLLQQFLAPGQLPMAKRQRLAAMQAAIDQQQETMPRPAPAPPLKAVAARLLAARRHLLGLVPLGLKAAISTVVVGGAAYVLVSPDSVLPAAILTAVFWLAWLAVGYLQGARGYAQAVAGFQSEIEHWQSAQTDALAYGEVLRQLSDMRRALADAEQRVAEVLERLQAARDLLAGPEPPDFPPANTAVTAEVAGSLIGTVAVCGDGGSSAADGGAAPDLAGLGVEDMVAAVLAKAGLGGELNLGTALSEDAQEALAERLLQAAQTELPPRGLFLHMRAVQPLTGEPQHAVGAVVCRLRRGRPPDLGANAYGGNDPFVVAEFTVTRPFTLADSARTEAPPPTVGVGR